MKELTHEEHLAARLLEGLGALRDGRPRAARRALEPVVSDAQLAASTEMRDIRARACSLMAQACLQDEDAEQAGKWAMEAMRQYRAEEDRDGLNAIRALHTEIRAARDVQQRARVSNAENARLAALSVDEVLEGAATDLVRADRLIKKSQADFQQGDTEGATRVALQAITLADSLASVREQVLARMALAQAQPVVAAEVLLAAWTCASDANEFNLVGLVSRCAERMEVTLPTLHGPAMGSDTQ